MNDLTLHFDESPSTDDVAFLIDEVRKFNTAMIGSGNSQPLAALARSADGVLVGGVAGRTSYCWLLIDVVWVEETHRGRGLGRALMELAERKSRERGCVGAQVDTLSFQGIEFYQCLGYGVIGHLQNYPQGCSRYFLAKHYDTEGAS